MESARVKENSFISVKSLPVNSISMCLQSSLCAFSLLLIFFPIATLLVNAVNFPGTTRPFSIVHSKENAISNPLD